ncbi:hypothetical protein ACM66B_005808 [Microbotryomycetes sp. NB124-2]
MQPPRLPARPNNSSYGGHNRRGPSAAPAPSSYASTSHHRAEDYQQNEAYSSYRKPTAPPELRAASAAPLTSRDRIPDSQPPRYPVSSYNHHPRPDALSTRSSYRTHDDWDRRQPPVRQTGGWKDASPPRRPANDAAYYSTSSIKGKEKASAGSTLAASRPGEQDVRRPPSNSSHVSTPERGQILAGNDTQRTADTGTTHQSGSVMARQGSNDRGQSSAMQQQSQSSTDGLAGCSTVYFPLLPDFVRGEDLERLLAPFGTVLRTSIRLRKSGSGVYAHVTMTTPEQASKAVSDLMDASRTLAPGTHPLRLSVHLAQSTARSTPVSLATRDGSAMITTASSSLFNREPTGERDEPEVKQCDSPQKPTPTEPAAAAAVRASARPDTILEPRPGDLQLTIGKFVNEIPSSLKRTRKGGAYIVTYRTQNMWPKDSPAKIGQPYKEWRVEKGVLSPDQRVLTVIVIPKLPSSSAKRREPSNVERSPESPRHETPLSPRSLALAQKSTAKVPMDVDEDQTGLVELVHLPISCQGASDEASKARKAFRLSAIKQALAQGKIVLHSSFEGDCLKLTYEIDSTQQSNAVAALVQPPAPVRQPFAGRATSTQNMMTGSSRGTSASTRSTPPNSLQVDASRAEGPIEDVKPVVTTRLPSTRLKPPLLTPRQPIYFPLGLNASTAETQDVERNVEEFIREYFARFDSNRASLDQFYSNTATFSVRVNTTPPPRCRRPAEPFANRFIAHNGKTAHTPVPIVNVISRLPAGSHNISQLTYDARELPELQSRPGLPNSILLHMQGVVEEFPQHIVRSIRRTIVLVPKTVLTGGIGNPLRFLIQSDSLIYAHYDPDAPSPLPTAPPPPEVTLPPASRPPASRSPTTASSSVPEKRSRQADVVRDSQTASDSVSTVSNGDRPPPPKKRTITKPAAPARPAAIRVDSESRSPEPVPPSNTSSSGPPVGVFMTPAEVEALVERKVAAEIAAERQRLSREQGLARASTSQTKSVNGAGAPKAARQPPASPSARSTASSQRSANGSAAATGPVLMGQTTSVSHGFDGKTNKMRWLVNTGNSLMGVSLLGDVIEYDAQMRGGVRNIAGSRGSTFRIDDFAYSVEKSTLIVPYLGARSGKDWLQPPHQVVLFKKDPSTEELVQTPLVERPHNVGGITAITALPGPETGRLRFVTAGEDKTLFLWTRTRSTGAITTDKLGSDHTSTVTGLACLRHKDWIVSGGKDKRVIAYDPAIQRSIWSTTAPAAVLAVETMPNDPNLILARLGTANDQFQVYDVRKPNTTIQHFGWALPLKRTTTTKAPTAPTLGRYLRGSFCDTLYAHPDSELCVKVWDLRSLKSAPKSQTLAAGKSRVIQSMWRGRNEMVLLELNNITTVKLR